MTKLINIIYCNLNTAAEYFLKLKKEIENLSEKFNLIWRQNRGKLNKYRDVEIKIKVDFKF